jgi:hypothetical protein
MDWLEQELRQALGRKEPSPGFAERASAAARRRPTFAMPRWVPAAAAIVVMVGGGAAYREYEGRMAKQQVMEAMRITAGKLNRIQSQIKQVRP